MRMLYKGKYLTLFDQDGWEFVDRPASNGVVAIVAISNKSILLVEQFRRSQGASVVSLPGGLVDRSADDSSEEAAHRELLEETGFVAEKMRRLITGPISPGMTTETVTIFLAENIRQQEEPRGDGDEVLGLHRVPLDNVFAWLGERRAAGAMVDLKVYLGLAVVGRTP